MKIKTNAHFKGKSYNSEKTESYLADLIGKLDLLNRCYAKLGYDAEYFEYEPINFIGFDYGELTNEVPDVKIFKKDGRSVSNLVCVTYFLFAKKQLYMYSYKFSTDFSYRHEVLTEIFFSDISAVSVTGGHIRGSDIKGNKFKIANNYITLSYGNEHFKMPIMPDIDMNNKTIFDLRKLIRDKKFLNR